MNAKISTLSFYVPEWKMASLGLPKAYAPQKLHYLTCLRVINEVTLCTHKQTDRLA